MRNKARTAAAVVALGFLAGLTGCSAQAGRITGPDAKLAANEGSPAFLDRVASQRVVSQNDACRGLLMLIEGEDKTETFAQRVEKLSAKGIIAATWGQDAGRPVTKGRLAYMIYQATKIPGGVILMLTGPSQRYCLRELQYHHMMSTGTPGTTVTGLEFVAVLSRADVYRRTGEVPAIMEVVPSGG